MILLYRGALSLDIIPVRRFWDREQAQINDNRIKQATDVLADTHCHLNFERFDPDRASVIERAVAAGVTRMLNPGVDLPSSLAAVELAQQFEPVYAAVGVHPNEALSWTDESLPALRELALRPKVVAIGEIGLDYYWEQAPHELQQQVFSQQLDLAAEFGLPVVVHLRDRDEVNRPALRDALKLLAAWKCDLEADNSPLSSRAGVLHSFSADLGAAEWAVEMSFWIGVTGPVTFKKADTLKNVAAQAPVEMLLIETDAPFLTPHPHRGERNEPAYVQFVAKEIAALRQVESERIARITTENAKRLFHW